ncbi:hypothetical protein PUNSTDRAFT_50784 [Punctularia strigosozonata HHB-11173 SS5]|uniref:uncharacterized protein n=1 Tax=Punctularia strigosozonata (strain HHB-11173) TaxID=741275 RepID=UPI0004416F63|nr:uncharacterized protein PUNSTDRAFT_50784 [Punctularia strigosozonata HHB-11173 SS5]EIN12008.1 hypothetical protein PUNSTDRAFT_50784 [Punctularia strigosozonata HHB-11173 SS5]
MATATTLHPMRYDNGPSVFAESPVAMPTNLQSPLDLYPRRFSSSAAGPANDGRPSHGPEYDGDHPEPQADVEGANAPRRSRTSGSPLTSPAFDEPPAQQAPRNPAHESPANYDADHANGAEPRPSSQDDKVLSYVFPAGSARYGGQLSPPATTPGIVSPESAHEPSYLGENAHNGSQPQSVSPGQGSQSFRDSLIPYVPSSPRHPALPVMSSAFHEARSPITPMSASPTYAPSGPMPVNIVPKPKVYPQQPTYVTPAASPNPINPVYSPSPLPIQEEVCVECAMRDQDMADVDVTSPGVWERESDVHFHELLRQEEEEEAAGIVSDDPERPKARGDPLITPNLKAWLAMNPKEPTSRQQTLNQYVKSQRALLEAEALAHARAMQESRQIDNKMRDAYSQLRRSAYDIGSSAAPADDIGGVRIKAPRSTSMPSVAQHAYSNSREVTLLENGMIVEHVDVRKEEKEERERRRKEERREKSRARKSSRGSGADVLSVYSAHSPLPMTDNGFHSGVKPDSRFSQASSGRPASVLTAPLDRSGLPRAYSQASFSDVQSIGPASPRRSRFLGTLSPWRSRDSLAVSGISGSMVDMHVALQREEQRLGHVGEMSMDMGVLPDGAREKGRYPAYDAERAASMAKEAEKQAKKKKGLAKFWRIVTGSYKSKPSPNQARSLEKPEDDLPLAPPPPLSYLVDRGSGDHRHVSSMPSLPSTSTANYSVASPAMTLSPATAPSSLVPSPVSSRKSAGEHLHSDGEGNGLSDQDSTPGEDRSRAAPAAGTSQEVGGRGRISPNSRREVLSSLDIPLYANAARPGSMIRRDKSLPPLPPEARSRHPTSLGGDMRPTTVFTYDPRQAPFEGSSTVHELAQPQAPFRTAETRRQSFGGMATRPQMAQTLPATRAPSAARPEAYDEFGSAAAFNQANGSAFSLRTPKKRRSKFGLVSFLGKKSVGHEPEPAPVPEFPLIRSSSSDARHEGMINAGYAGAASPVSIPRMSVTSRKALEDLVDQDREFVAYRYPSDGQEVELLR